MKPFNLEKALAGELVQTRGGDKVTNIIVFPVVCDYSVRAVVNGSIYAFTKDGRMSSGKSSSALDLLMVAEPEKITLSQEEWLKYGPWWVTVKTNPTLYCVLCVCMDGTIKIDYNGEYLWVSPKQLELDYKRTRDGIKFEPCFKEKL